MNLFSLFRRRPDPRHAEAAQREQRDRLIARLVLEHEMDLALVKTNSALNAAAIEILMVLGGHKAKPAGVHEHVAEQCEAASAESANKVATLRALLEIDPPKP